ncbi:MAG: hypothetical protein K2J77_05170, partial [Oscillospiraceae bacterium]|nr:hypothetical protein [Oscillospiraceae bacterium]
ATTEINTYSVVVSGSCVLETGAAEWSEAKRSSAEGILKFFSNKSTQVNKPGPHKFQKVSRFSKKILTGSLSAAQWRERSDRSEHAVREF